MSIVLLHVSDKLIWKLYLSHKYKEVIYKEVHSKRITCHVKPVSTIFQYFVALKEVESDSPHCNSQLWLWYICAWFLQPSLSPTSRLRIPPVVIGNTLAHVSWYSTAIVENSQTFVCSGTHTASHFSTMILVPTCLSQFMHRRRNETEVRQLGTLG